mgnify:CR=1 FL=1
MMLLVDAIIRLALNSYQTLSFVFSQFINIIIDAKYKENIKYDIAYFVKQ